MGLMGEKGSEEIHTVQGGPRTAPRNWGKFEGDGDLAEHCSWDRGGGNVTTSESGTGGEKKKYCRVIHRISAWGECSA